VNEQQVYFPQVNLPLFF